MRSDTDGAVVFVRQVAREFEKRGCQVDIYTPLGYTGGSRMEAKAQEQKSAQSSVEGARIIRFEVPGVATPSYSKPGLEFINRIAVSLGEASYFSDRKLFNYDSVLLVHMAHTFGVVNAGLVPLERTVVCPMLLGSYYSTYMAVPQAYMDIERETISKLMHIQSPSRDEARALTGAYGANPNSVFVV
ncbi:MAG TPA: glycosyltransferase family 4 protein, partial [Candidatus Micrarchaeota archaeon]|nr:glycosyltransferase family 4 protein [Candidatus Micrarchaeota archaeon]